MKISVVMPSYNQCSFVEEAINSVLDQDYPDKEIIFVDGKSTDGTVEVAEQYKRHFAHWLCEPDRGQSDALAKGFMRASGDVLTWLNTDDLLLPGALAAAAEALTSSRVEWALGNVIWIDRDGRILRCWRGEPYSAWASPRTGLLTPGGPSTFFTKRLYDKVGGLNRKLHYQMDTELWWKFAMEGIPYVRLEGYCWALRLHDAAKVSGHMFSDPNDPRQRAIAAAKDAESEHIRKITEEYRLLLPNFLQAAIKVLRRTTSTNYWRGQLDDWCWRGRSINELKSDPVEIASSGSIRRVVTKRS